jgi:hypothetical protein
MLNFPNAPSAGQMFAPSGAPTYQYDGQKWTLYGKATRSPPFDGNPSMDGVATAGLGSSYARGDHRHPVDTSRAPIANASFTGTLTADLLTNAGDITINGKIVSTSKVNQIGMHGGTGAASAMPWTDAILLFYMYSDQNWCGWGVDNSGNVWLRSGTSGYPAPSFYANASDQVVNFLRTPTIPTPGAGDNSTNLANTAFVKARAPAAYPLAGGTVNGNVTLAGPDLWVHNNGNYGVLYLGNTGSRYLQWDGSNYNLNGAHCYAGQGRLVGTGDWGGGWPIYSARMVYAGDQGLSQYTGMTEPYGGACQTGASGVLSGGGIETVRWRYMQVVTSSWWTLGYA